jgi:murein DD-endopeptidase MepM/ murein hydrolase activator NlpD
MSFSATLRDAVVLGILFIISACSIIDPTPIVEVVTVEITATPSPTPTATSTPTPTPTPTPTAFPITITGDHRATRISTPLPQFGAQCGIVDILDFPLKPPDAIGTRGGSDFGVFRSRYNGYHTGEDWGISGGSNFGESVFSIGHGLVTHAHPDGWGEDKGTVIIKHTFSDGSIIYSFYGHLDPPSVTMNAGQCVTRGEKIGEIGRPRTPPHLHFEIRAVFPDQPARGYLPYDPSIAGWKPPSNYILEQRITTSPGVVWMRQSSDVVVEEVGFVDESIFLVKEDDQLVAIDLTDGNTLWSQPLARSFVDGSIDRDRSILYTVNRTGDLKAFSLEDAANGWKS